MNFAVREPEFIAQIHHFGVGGPSWTLHVLIKMNPSGIPTRQSAEEHGWRQVMGLIMKVSASERMGRSPRHCPLQELTERATNWPDGH